MCFNFLILNLLNTLFVFAEPLSKGFSSLKAIFNLNFLHVINSWGNNEIFQSVHNRAYVLVSFKSFVGRIKIKFLQITNIILFNSKTFLSLKVFWFYLVVCKVLCLVFVIKMTNKYIIMHLFILIFYFFYLPHSIIIIFYYFFW